MSYQQMISTTTDKPGGKFKIGQKVDRLSCYEDAPVNGTIKRRSFGPYEDYLVEWPNGGETWEEWDNLSPANGG